MQEALYIEDGIAQKIVAKQIQSRTEYMQKYNGHLFCCTPGCTAQLSFALTPNFKSKKIFKTSKYSEHAETCPHRIIHTDAKQYRYSSETINQALSDKHKHDILKKLFERNVEQDIPKVVRKSKRRRTQRISEQGMRPRPVPGLTSDAVVVKEGQREPSVIKRRSNDLLPEDVGHPRGVDGYSKFAIINENYIEIYLENNVSVLFFNAFRDSEPSAYQQVLKIAHDINEHQLSVLICCIGVVEQKSSGYQIQIMDSSVVRFDNKAASSFYITA